jgi:D-serine deaminase-like pyridoxal phosphate-dependent protein
MGFVIQGKHIPSALMTTAQARHECNEYLASVTQHPTQLSTVNKTTGLILELITLIEENGEGSGLADESVKSLKRLTGNNTN